MRKLTKRSAAFVGGSVLAITGGTAAFAYASGWFNGSGTVNAQSSTIQPVIATINGVSNIWPGHAVNATASIGNYNEYPVTATSVDAKSIVVKVYDNAADVNNKKESTDCGQNDAHITLADPDDVNIDAGKTVGATFPNFVSMTEDASPKCAGKIFKITFKLNGELRSA
ncbi:hypothetical protein ACQP2F_42060 [Actinoplanes sp. CA-030573]|uniref:hypothetical protein n=1 Tax=Actinoplanes sp. CA-030573 TaxID=3239898 RepID=UPI003D8D96A6